ncbi:clostripain-related cysteine peptidase [Sphingobacterium sp. WOUb80]|uniref:clostripain-related cysteine peptidase n=1 Tax=Sphingobacterium sp. WOUb80 TaxID=3234028 RepID=UPI003CEF3F49
MRSIKYFILYVLTLAFSSCAKDELPHPTGRTVMVYMAANNSLNGDAYTNINQMESAFKDVDGKLLVYARLKNVAPAIYEISYDTGTAIGSRIVKTYAEHNSSDPLVMRSVIQDMQALAPAESYGLILWSHATSWLPDPSIRLKSFGDDAGETMDIISLKNALPDALDFLVFDACSMASVEVIYQLRDKAHYILASPAEVIAVGMPYHTMLRYLYQTDLVHGLNQAAQAYYDYYNQQNGPYRSATITLVDNQKLPILAAQVGEILRLQSATWSVLERDNVQRLDFAEGSPTAGFDLLEFYQLNFPEADLSGLKQALTSSILFKAHTAQFNGKIIRSYSGLSMYIPHVENAWVHPYYKTLDWYNASDANYLFKWVP